MIVDQQHYQSQYLASLQTQAGTQQVTDRRNLRRVDCTTNHRTYAQVVRRGLYDNPPNSYGILISSSSQFHGMQPVPRLRLVIPDIDDTIPMLLLQREGRIISELQLASEVDVIYKSLNRVEGRCSEVMREELAAAHAKIDLYPQYEAVSWTEYIELHRTLLHEHHDLILALQHPNASKKVRQIPSKHHTPQRMWTSGMQPLLRLLRSWLEVQNIEERQMICGHTLKFVSLAYLLLSLLYETAPAFRNFWILYLGHLSRYRVCIETQNVDARDHWCSIARSWYSKLFDLDTSPRDIYYHLATVTYPEPIVQLVHLIQSLMSPGSTVTSQQHLASTIRHATFAPSALAPSLGTSNFLRLHLLFLEASAENRAAVTQLENQGACARADELNQSLEQIDQLAASFGQALINLQSSSRSWNEGAYMAIINISSWFEYGANCNIFRQSTLWRTPRQRECDLYPLRALGLLSPTSTSIHPLFGFEQTTTHEINTGLRVLHLNPFFQRCHKLTMRTLSVILRQTGGPFVTAHMHILAAFLVALAETEDASHLIEMAPWLDLVEYLNNKIRSKIEQDPSNDINNFIIQPLFQNQDEATLLPEDHLLRGLIWTQQYFPRTWFDRDLVDQRTCDDIERIQVSRDDRVLRLGYRLSQLNKHIYRSSDSKFYVQSAQSTY